LGKKKELVVDFDVGEGHVFASTQTNRFYCWGNNQKY